MSGAVTEKANFSVDNGSQLNTGKIQAGGAAASDIAQHEDAKKTRSLPPNGRPSPIANLPSVQSLFD